MLIRVNLLKMHRFMPSVPSGAGLPFTFEPAKEQSTLGSFMGSIRRRAGFTDVTEAVLEIVEPRPSSALELGQLGDDDGKRQSIASILGIQAGFAGWNARVVEAGRVQTGFKIAKMKITKMAS